MKNNANDVTSNSGSTSQTKPLFGSQPSGQQPQQAGSLFGAQSNQQPTGSSLFGQQAQQQSSGLFGSTTQQSQPQQSTGLFGSSNQQSQPQQGSGLFGSSNQQSQSQPQQGTGLFGSNTQQAQPQQSGGLFGSSTTQSQPQQNSGLFGSNSQPQQSSIFGSFGQGQSQQGAGGSGQSTAQAQPQQQSGGLFSNLTNQNQQQQQPQETSLFNSQTQQQFQQGSLFNNPPSQPANPLLQFQPMASGAKIDADHLRPTTRFSDLHETLQKELEAVDGMIQRQISCHDQCRAMMPSHADKLSFLPNDVDYVSRRLKTLTEALENDAQAIDHVRSIARRDYDDTCLAFAVVDNLRLHPQYQHRRIWNGPMDATVSPSLVDPAPRAGAAGVGVGAAPDTATTARDLVAYFSHRADDMTRTLQTYTHSIAEIEHHLRGLEARTALQVQQAMFARGSDGEARSADDQVRELAVVLREFENGILGVAGKVGAAREGVQELLLEPEFGR